MDSHENGADTQSQVGAAEYILPAGVATAQSSSPIFGIGTLMPFFSACPSGSFDFFMARRKSLALPASVKPAATMDISASGSPSGSRRPRP